MAVLQGARLRGGALPASTAGAGRVRSAAPAAIHAVPRTRPTGLLMAGIVAATVVGMVYLTQTLGSNATSSEIRFLEAERTELRTEISRHVVLVLEATDSDTIVDAARALDLTRIRGHVVLAAP